MDRWVKLYEKSKKNGIMKDHTAWALFTWLLISVNKDTGKMSFGRFQISDELGIKPNTVYKVVQRLEKKYGVIIINRQTNYTEVQIVKWAKYQSSSTDSQMTVKSSSNDSNTLQDKRIKNNTYIQLSKNQIAKLKADFIGLDVEFELSKFKAWQKANDKTFPNVLERFRLWLMDCKQKEKQTPSKSLQRPVFKVNPIVSDPLFKSYLEVYYPTDDTETRKKMALETQLSNKYSTFKYSSEWAEARQQIPKFN